MQSAPRTLLPPAPSRTRVTRQRASRVHPAKGRSRNTILNDSGRAGSILEATSDACMTNVNAAVSKRPNRPRLLLALKRHPRRT
eukprot:3960574-Pleurochrysis_carterae.AAC.6